MGIFTNNPVLEREVRGRLRLRPKGRRGANIWVARLLGVVVVYYYARGLLGVWHGTMQDARDFWPLLTYGALALIVLLAPALAATAISTEREQQTWEILATTRLTGAEVLLGKWLGRQMIPWLLVVILLPFMAVCTARAGFGWPMLPSVLAFLLVTTACYAALGLLCSFQAKRTMTATAAALTFSALLCIGSIIVSQVFQSLGSGSLPPYASPALWVNPFYALGWQGDVLTAQPPPLGVYAAPDDVAPAVAAYYLLSLIFTAGALVFMVRRYHRAVRERS
jgi:ABC-type transport system involved in multi-copper enzyme maturation permease subunit